MSSTPQFKTREIGTGDAAIMTTLEHMRRLARRDVKTPDVKVLLEKIRQEAEPWAADANRYRFELARACFLWVINNIDYQYDHEHVSEHADVADPMNTEFVIAPRHLISIGKGDCDDMSTMLATLLGALGFEVQFKIIAHKGDYYSHVYLETKLPNAEGVDVWVPLDPVMGADGWLWEKGEIIRKDTMKVF